MWQHALVVLGMLDLRCVALAVVAACPTPSATMRTSVLAQIAAAKTKQT